MLAVVQPFVNDSFDSVKQNLSRHQLKEVKFLELVKQLSPAFKTLSHNPQTNPTDGMKGDFLSPNGTGVELKVDRYSARNSSPTIFIEYAATDTKGQGLVPKAVLNTEAAFYFLPLKRNGHCQLAVIHTDTLRLLAMDAEQKRTTGKGANGNVGDFTTFGRLVPISKILSCSKHVIPLPDDFFELWARW